MMPGPALSQSGSFTLAQSLVWGARDWATIAAILGSALLLVLLWGYWRAGATRSVRLLAASLKIIGIAILALCLLEPLFSGTRARPGANVFVVLTDNSQSMTLHDRETTETRAQQLKSLIAKPAQWLSRIGQDFDLRPFAFDTQLRSPTELEKLTFDGGASNLGAALQRIARQFQGRPLAGIALLTDGSATDADAVDALLKQSNLKLPPIYPVVFGSDKTAGDVNVQNVAVSQTNFEDAPVTVTALLASAGYAGQTVAANLVDEAGKTVEQQKVRIEQDGTPQTVRFRLKPEHPGVSFYRVKIDADKPTDEATLANNARLVTVDRAKGPYRILYLAGRPNWEYKFLQRSLQSDDQVQLVGLLRIAKREPKFNYISHANERTNPLYRGFEGHDTEQAEQYDQPVMVRLGTADANELRGGFPKSAEELYKYHAIVLDDLESEFFTQDQMQLIKEFVRNRGGGLLMLGGQESFKNGKYDRSPIGDVLPVYVDDVADLAPDAQYRLSLTREGWLEPWVRLRPEEDAERSRLSAMPEFTSLNPVRGIKPGATVLANVLVNGVTTMPALVEQRFGHGRAAAMLIGDLWRWELRRGQDAEEDLPKAWRQTIRWLVSEVPRRVEMIVEPRHEADDPEGMLNVGVRVRDSAYAPQDNAAVTIRVTPPDGKLIELSAEPSSREAGLYEAAYVPRQPGAYRAQATALAPDGSEIAKVDAGWASDPSADEFRELKPNRALMERLANSTGGQMIAPRELDSFAASLPNRHADITEPYIRPIWHQPWVLGLAIACLCAEWGLRRWKGLP